MPVDKDDPAKKLLAQAAPWLDRFYAEIDPMQFRKMHKSDTQKSRTILEIEAMLRQLGKDDFLVLKLKHLPKNFSFSEKEPDEDTLQKALMEKYDV